MSESQPNLADPPSAPSLAPGRSHRGKSRFEVFGEEMIEKQVKPSGKSGRIYLPPEWVGKSVKVIRIS